jgi:hypothetical protein
MQSADDERHETPPRILRVSPPSGVDVIFHVDPFDASPRVASTTELEDCSPTAVQALVDVHETARRKLPVASAGTALGWTLQVVPVETSTSGTVVRELFS